MLLAPPAHVWAVARLLRQLMLVCPAVVVTAQAVLMFRNAIQANNAWREAYSALKLKLASAHSNDRLAYVHRLRKAALHAVNALHTL